MRRGFSLTGVMALCLFFFVMFVTLSDALSQNRQRMATEKLRQAAVWMSISGADVAQARLSKGQLKPGSPLVSPRYAQGQFKVVTRRAGSSVLLESTGTAGNQSHTTRRKVRVP